MKILVGDLVSPSIGDQVPAADGLFGDGHSLILDKSSMTGESEPIHVDNKLPFLVSGCKVANGYNIMLVTGVGMQSEWGHLMAELGEDTCEETPLQVHFNGFATFVSQIGLSFALLSKRLVDPGKNVSIGGAKSETFTHGRSRPAAEDNDLANNSQIPNDDTTVQPVQEENNGIINDADAVDQDHNGGPDVRDELALEEVARQ
ncbi:hypothetical protein L7F22_054612 [Adiantum nelumboides]|nr:hypothetical protein [Adiantum nelumboides]